MENGFTKCSRLGCNKTTESIYEYKGWLSFDGEIGISRGDGKMYAGSSFGLEFCSKECFKLYFFDLISKETG